MRDYGFYEYGSKAKVVDATGFRGWTGEYANNWESVKSWFRSWWKNTPYKLDYPYTRFAKLNKWQLKYEFMMTPEEYEQN